MSIRNAFKMKNYDLEPLFASWTDCPVFTGNSKKDMPLKEWLEVVKAGCVSRKVPEECWPKVAQHFMSGTALYRIKEVKKVMQQLHGGLFRWSWTKFRVAMENMEWDEKSNTETKTLSGSFWTFGGKKSEDTASVATSSTSQPPPVPPKGLERPTPQKSKTTDSSFWSRKKENKDPASTDPTPARPPPRKSTTWADALPLSSLRNNASSASITEKGKSVEPAPIVAVVEVPKQLATVPPDAPKIPKWMIDATSAVSSLKSDHPKVMNLAAAILIGIGSIPTMPGIAAGAGGAIFASGAVQAVGAIAVGIGNMIQVVQQASDPNAQEVAK